MAKYWSVSQGQLTAWWLGAVSTFTLGNGQSWIPPPPASLFVWDWIMQWPRFEWLPAMPASKGGGLLIEVLSGPCLHPEHKLSSMFSLQTRCMEIPLWYLRRETAPISENRLRGGQRSGDTRVAMAMITSGCTPLPQELPPNPDWDIDSCNAGSALGHAQSGLLYRWKFYLSTSGNNVRRLGRP